jgi:glutamine cyclotransferase
MRFGPTHKIRLWSLSGVILMLFFCLSNCKQDDKPIGFITPLQGDNVNLGDNVEIQISVNDKGITSITYLIDEKLFATKKNTTSVVLRTAALPLGFRLITAIVKRGDQLDTVNTNIVLKTNRAPQQLKYQVIRSYPHDTSAYTEGLSFVDGNLLESTGEKGNSELKYLSLESGKTIKKVKLAPQYFGEGSLKIDNKIIMLTWQENRGFIFDAKTLKELGTFPYEKSREGWGLTFDGKQILRSDGTNRIWLMNAKTYKEEGFIEVYDDKGPVNNLNELEFIDGKIFANVYQTNKIVKINPKNGLVEAEINLSALVPKNFFKTIDEHGNNVLNGIAWDANTKRLFVGGKKWPKLYEIKLIP